MDERVLLEIGVVGMRAEWEFGGRGRGRGRGSKGGVVDAKPVCRDSEGLEDDGIEAVQDLRSVLCGKACSRVMCRLSNWARMFTVERGGAR